MGQAVPTQHPAVVLRSHFNQLRALLAVALIAVIGLTVAVVILATSEGQTGSTNTATPIGHINYGGFNPATGRPDSAPPPQQQHPLQTGSRYDGGPEEGTSQQSFGQARTQLDEQAQEARRTDPHGPASALP